LNEDNNNKDKETNEEGKITPGNENINKPEDENPIPENIKEEKEPEQKQIVPKRPQGESNYQISLISENLLRIKVMTDKSIGVDCSVKDRRLSGTGEVQTNKILIHPNSDKRQQEVEIIISINPETLEIESEKKKYDKAAGMTAAERPIFTPNPDVADLIAPARFKEPEQEPVPKTPDEILEEKLWKKNPYRLLREKLRRNLISGFISALIIFFVMVTIFFSAFSEQDKSPENQETTRLIVIQDLPEPKINLQEMDDPNKPLPEENKEDETKDTKVPNVISPRNIIRSPRIKRPMKPIEKTDTTTLSDATRELDSLRKLAVRDSIKKSGITETAKGDSILKSSDIADSLKNVFVKAGIPLVINYFPKNWKLQDSRDINTNTKEFEGIVLMDTSAAERGTLNIFILLDNNEEKYKSQKENYKQKFPMEDTLITAYSREPYNQAKYMKYEFFIFGKTNKVHVNAEVKEQFFDKYKALIEAVIRSIRI